MTFTLSLSIQLLIHFCSLLLTTFCLEHSPSTVACVCIHLSCRWKGLDIPRSSDGKSWWEYIDHSINRTKLDGRYFFHPLTSLLTPLTPLLTLPTYNVTDLTKEFLMIYDKSPSRLQKKITEPIKLQVRISNITMDVVIMITAGLKCRTWC